MGDQERRDREGDAKVCSSHEALGLKGWFLGGDIGSL